MKKLSKSSLLALGMVALAGVSAFGQAGGDPLDPVSMRRSALQLGGGALSRSYTGTEFNPAISVVVDSVYGHRSEDIDAPTGFVFHDGENIENGFELREIELAFEASVDPYFDAFVMIAFEEDDAEIEEAYISTRSLPVGLQLKLGKFFSDVGYINKQHMHDWLFVDAPWMREFFFGEEGLNEVGVQLSWLPPLPTYVRLGVEVLEGETDGIAHHLGSDEHDFMRDHYGPRLFTAFAKWGTDIAYNHAIQLGTSGGYSRLMQWDDDHSEGILETWDGDGWFAGLDAVYKYDGRGVMGHRNFVLQGEYIYRQLDLEYRNSELDGPFTNQSWKQDGLYVQGVYGFAPRWNAGLRADVLGIVNDGYEEGGMPVDFGRSYRHTAQLSYAPTEFSRLRAQVSYEDMADGEDAWSVALQYNISIGVHGAHAF